MKLLPNHIMVWQKFCFKLMSDIIVKDYTTKKILKSHYIFKNFISFIFNKSVYTLISSTKSFTSARGRAHALCKMFITVNSDQNICMFLFLNVQFIKDCSWFFAMNMAWSLKFTPLKNIGQTSFSLIFPILQHIGK